MVVSERAVQEGKVGRVPDQNRTATNARVVSAFEDEIFKDDGSVRESTAQKEPRAVLAVEDRGRVTIKISRTSNGQNLLTDQKLAVRREGTRGDLDCTASRRTVDRVLNGLALIDDDQILTQVGNTITIQIFQ